MPDESEMTVPVTRGEMHAALARWATTIVETLDKRLDERFTAFGAEMRALVDATQREALRQVQGMLEAKVFPPRRGATAARRKRS